MELASNLVLISPTDLKAIVASAVLEQLQNYLPKDKQPFAEYADFVTIDTVAEMCNVSRSTVNNWIVSGRLKPTRNGRVIRFAKADVIALLQQKPKSKRVAK
jgi:excisionase family DNA binding protein